MELNKTIVDIAKIYLLIVILHYISSHAYVNYCVPNTIKGFLLSPLTITQPHCQALRWIIYNGGNKITTSWLILGSWIIRQLPIRRK